MATNKSLKEAKQFSNCRNVLLEHCKMWQGTQASGSSAKYWQTASTKRNIGRQLKLWHRPILNRAVAKQHKNTASKRARELDQNLTLNCPVGFRSVEHMTELQLQKLKTNSIFISQTLSQKHETWTPVQWETITWGKYSFLLFPLHVDAKRQRMPTVHKVCYQLLNMVVDIQQYNQPRETLGVVIALHGHITAQEYDAI